MITFSLPILDANGFLVIEKPVNILIHKLPNFLRLRLILRLAASICLKFIFPDSNVFKANTPLDG